MVKSKLSEESLTYQKILEGEERFRNLADTAPMFIAMADETGSAIYFNKPWLKFTGKKLKEMLGMGWLSTLHPEDAPRFEKDFKDAFEKQIPIHKEYRFKRYDGKYRWMLAVGAPRFTPDGHFIGYYGTYTDFHELKESQLALKQSEDRFRTLIEKSADAVQLVTATGEIIFSSNSIENVLGYTPEELAHEGVSPYLHPDDTAYFFEQFADLLAHPSKQIIMQYRVKHKDGSWAWLETVGVNHLNTPNINALVGNFRNITKQKLAEDTVKRSEARFRALADNIPNLAWMAKSDGYIYWYNSRWYEYTGTTPEQMEGWGWQSVHDPEQLPYVLKQWKKSIKSGKAFDMVFPLKGADDTFRPFLTRCVPIRSEDGKIIQWVGTNTDISEQLRTKQAEARAEELEKLATQLSLQRKELLELNNAKDDFISLASHQLRTPATGVKQYVSLLLDGYAGELTSIQKEYAEHAYESNEREISIINDLLHVAQVDAGKMRLHKKTINIVSLLQSIIDEQAQKIATKNQKCKYSYSVPTQSVFVDEERLRMALENLLDNAHKYSPEGTTITVKLETDSKANVVVKIKDEGVGIDTKDQVKIFGKFIRTENSHSDVVAGSGLGLYLVKKIIDLHDGTISLKSTYHKGSTFTIKLPLDQVSLITK